MKWIGSLVAEIWPFAYVGAYGTPILGEGEVVGGHAAMAPLERAMVVSYRLSAKPSAGTSVICLCLELETAYHNTG